MPRQSRVEAPGAIHHVTARGNERRAIVLDDWDRGVFISRLAETVRRYGWVLWAYCLMDNHFHLMVETPEPNLGAGMQWLKGRHAQDLNYRHGRTGHVFGGRFFSELVEREAHGVSTAVYIPMNPVRAGMVDHPAKWPWSSYEATAGLEPAPPFLAVDRVLALFDQRPDVARREYREAIDAAVEEHVRRGRCGGVRPVGSDPTRSVTGGQGQTRGV